MFLSLHHTLSLHLTYLSSTSVNMRLHGETQLKELNAWFILSKTKENVYFS